MKILQIIFCCLLTMPFLKSQDISSYVINSAGTFLSSNASSTYVNIGEPISTEIGNADVLISQGFLQVTLVNEIVKTESVLSERISVYPNPVSQYIQIELHEKQGNYEAELYDLQGQLLQRETIQTQIQKVYLQNLSAGTYLLRIKNEDNKFQTLKIIKQ